MAHKAGSLVAQSVVLRKDRFRTFKQARAWIRRNGFIATKVDETENTWRFRQRNPDEFRPRTYATIELSPGAALVSARLKRQYLKGNSQGPPADHSMRRGGSFYNPNTGRWES